MSDLAPISPVMNERRARATFYGTAFHKVSGRNQVAIPRQHKRAIDEAHEDQLLLVRWKTEAFLRLYTKSQFDQKLDEVKQNSSLTVEQRVAVVEMIARNAEPVEPDSQGRFVLPGKWVDALNIREEVAFCGVHTYIKVWPAEAQRASEKTEMENVNAAVEQVTQTLNF